MWKSLMIHQRTFYRGLLWTKSPMSYNNPLQSLVLSVIKDTLKSKAELNQFRQTGKEKPEVTMKLWNVSDSKGPAENTKAYYTGPGFLSWSHLVTGLTARFEPLSVVSAAVDLSVLVEVNQIDEQLAAGGALETLRMPAAAVSCTTGKHGYVSAADLPAALEKQIELGWAGVWCRGKEVRRFILWQMVNSAGRTAICSHSPCNH